MVHHTASGAESDGQPDVNYCTYCSENRPIANLYLSRAGKVWVMAGGATNTNGSGRCPHAAPRRHELPRHRDRSGNSGTGEPWPDRPAGRLRQVVRALLGHYGIGTGSTVAHHEYAEGRKIDPFGPSRWGNASGWMRRLPGRRRRRLARPPPASSEGPAHDG